jgi:hypothetical protein
VWSALEADAVSAPETQSQWSEVASAPIEIQAKDAPETTEAYDAAEVAAPAKKTGWFERLIQRVVAPDNEMVIALLLALFLGGLGAHWFYLGERGKAMVRLAITLVSSVLYIAGYIMAAIAVSLGGTGILGGLLLFLGLIGWGIVSVLVIIDIINILTDNW